MYLDTDNEMIHIYTMGAGESAEIDHFVGDCKAEAFSEDFFAKLGEVIDSYRESHPTVSLGKLSVIIPDSVIITDTLHVPFLSKSALNKSVDVLLSNLFTNSAEISFNRFVAVQSKEYATFAVNGARRAILGGIRKALSDRGISIANITFAANAAIDALLAMNAKLRGTSFVLLDVKERATRLAFVAKGRTTGFLTLPFGADILASEAVVAEEQLIDHAAAELIVASAKARAKSRILTVAGDSDASDDPDMQDTDGDEQGAEAADGARLAAENPAPELVIAEPSRERKSTRRLPKSLIRPIPETADGVLYENFRHILKWSLGAIAENGSLTSLGEPECVYVNLPERYSSLYDVLKEESEDSEMTLVPLSISEVDDGHLGELELYGGFFAKQHNKANNFRLSVADR